MENNKEYKALQDENTQLKSELNRKQNDLMHAHQDVLEQQFIKAEMGLRDFPLMVQAVVAQDPAEMAGLPQPVRPTMGLQEAPEQQRAEVTALMVLQAPVMGSQEMHLAVAVVAHGLQITKTTPEAMGLTDK